MAADDGRAAGPLTALLYDRDEAPRFEFWQAVRLLETMHARSARGPGRPAWPVRFRSHVGLDFPASDIRRIDPPAAPGAPPVMTVNFLGLAGALGPLPRPFTELLLERRASGHDAMHDFLDLFNHRLVWLLYGVRRRSRLALTLRRPERSELARPLAALCGVGTPALAGKMRREGVRDGALLPFAGLLAQRPRSMAGLEVLLGEYFAAPVRGVPLKGRWQALEPSEHTRLGRTGQHQVLGESAVLGTRVWDQQAAFDVEVGPLGLRRFLDFLPSGTAYRPLRELTRFYAGIDLDFAFRLKLEGSQVPPSRLGLRHGARLGWASWLKTRPYAAETAEVVLGPAAVAPPAPRPALRLGRLFAAGAGAAPEPAMA